MQETIENPNPRVERLLKRIREETLEEYETGLSLLRDRSDYRLCYDYFLDLLIRPLTPEKMQATIGKPIVEHLCNHAPYELFHAYGVHPVKMSSGCLSVQRLSASGFPVLMCPMLRSTIGMRELNARSTVASPTSVVPTTCDWVVKFPEMVNQNRQSVHLLELPHIRQGEKAQNRWLEEMYGLVAFLERMTGKRLKRAHLLASIHTFSRAWEALLELIEMRRRRSISGVWFTVVANTFMLDSIEPWTRAVRKLIERLERQPNGDCRHRFHGRAWVSQVPSYGEGDPNVAPGSQAPRATKSQYRSQCQKKSSMYEKKTRMSSTEEVAPHTPKKTNKAVFLAGSPIIFPNFKLLHLVEDAGMNVCADDLCSSERVLPGAVRFDDPSWHGLIRALAERYHRGCTCPTFADNDRRVNSILHTCSRFDIRHVVYHVLKGCHPCDMESFIIEKRLANEGYKFLRIETDYAKEDSRNILTRLEAFGQL